MEGRAMSLPNEPQHLNPEEPIPGDPLIEPTDGGAHTVSSEVPPVVSAPAAGSVSEARPAERSDGEKSEHEGSKAKTAITVAGVAALANKVRHEAPKKLQELREKRAAGRCVIVSEASGRYMAIGPYKDEETARQDLFKVGGTAHVAELVTTTAFFTPPPS
jgi:hypothetical protein